MARNWFTLILVAFAAMFALAFFACSGGDDDDDDSSDDDVDDDDDDDSDDDEGPPTYPTNHDAAWDCMICHETSFNGASGEPHGDSYAAPADCVGCHQMGDWVNESSAPAAMNVGQDCTGCHANQHDKPFADPDMCLVCHQ